MKKLAVTLVLLVIVTAGFLSIRARLDRPAEKVPPPARVTPVSFTDSNGSQFTVYVGRVVVNGTNLVVSNLNVKIRPIQPGTVTRRQTNETSK